MFVLSGLKGLVHAIVDQPQMIEIVSESVVVEEKQVSSEEKNMVIPEDALRSMYRLGVVAGRREERERLTASTKKSSMPVIVRESTPSIRQVKLPRTYSPAYSTKILPTRPAIRWKQPPAMLPAVKIVRNLDTTYLDCVRNAPTLLTPKVKH